MNAKSSSSSHADPDGLARRRSWRQSDSPVLRSWAGSRIAQVSSVVLVLSLLAALLAPWLAVQNPYDPATLELLDAFTRPTQEGLSGARYLLGADDQGRDVFSAIVYGLRMSVAVGVSAVLLSLLIGVPLGMAAGYFGGWFDSAVMRIADVQLTFPVLLVALLIFGIARGILPAGYRDDMAVYVIVVAIALSDWVQYARTVRGAVMVEKQKDYVAAARLIGRSRTAILARHILPNLAAPVLVIATISFALAIVTESTLSYLGVGLPPTEPSLGTLIRIGQGFLFSGEWWILLYPALTLLALALSVNLVGDWLRDALNPKLQ
ncbi:MAG: Oligopeptide transport system permease protein OppC [Paracidovorax wautersii]|uniref:Oligopeptide transport system permease protein OppC n=1 Tax=Paracidovorax wautersii TaxID=1177982 RepID=A0A7V8FRE4_9BURK|nr:MAG: Oligopeptide transport system permease protein OppC [Paracidovorax wautersii]